MTNPLKRRETAGQRSRLRAIAGLVFVIFASVTIPVGHATVDRDGYFTYVKKTKPAPAGEQTRGRVSCPKDTVVVGGGVYTNGSSLEDEVASSAPFDGRDGDRRPDDGWSAEVNTGPSVASIDTHAICAPFLGIKYLAKKISVPPKNQISGSLACPDRARHLFGGGVQTGGSSTKVTLAQTMPDVDLGGYYLWRFAINNGTNTEINAKGWIVCGDPSTDDPAVRKDSPPASPGQASVSVECDLSEHVSGGGARISGGLDAEIASIYPFDSGDPGAVRDDGWTAWTNNETGVNQPREVASVCH